MWYPNKAQWWVIWIVALLASFIFVNSVHWRNQGVTFAFCLVGLGALLVWQLAKKS